VVPFGPLWSNGFRPVRDPSRGRIGRIYAPQRTEFVDGPDRGSVIGSQLAECRPLKPFHSGSAPRRATSRLTVEAARSRRLAISRIDEPEAIPREMSSRSASVSASRERRRAAGGMPPRQQHRANAAMWLVKGPPNLMQRLSRLPPAPNLTLLDRTKTKSLPWPHPTPPLHRRLTSDGVASTYRMHRGYLTSGVLVRYLTPR
jgi:hypothetical protein